MKLRNKIEFHKEAGPEFSLAGDPPDGRQHTILPNISKQLHPIENILVWRRVADGAPPISANNTLTFSVKTRSRCSN